MNVWEFFAAKTSVSQRVQYLRYSSLVDEKTGSFGLDFGSHTTKEGSESVLVFSLIFLENYRIFDTWWRSSRRFKRFDRVLSLCDFWAASTSFSRSMALFRFSSVGWLLWTSRAEPSTETNLSISGVGFEAVGGLGLVLLREFVLERFIAASRAL